MAAALIFIVLQNLPSPYAIRRIHNWDRQSLSGPLLRRLKTLDPQRTWHIALQKETRYNTWPLYYYRKYHYRFVIDPTETYDVAIVYQTEKPPRAIYLDKDYFAAFHCGIVVNPALLPQGVIPPARLTRE